MVFTALSEGGWADVGKQNVTFRKAIDMQGTDLNKSAIDEDVISRLRKMRVIGVATSGFVLAALLAIFFDGVELKDAPIPIGFSVPFGIGMGSFYAASAFFSHKLIKGHTTKEKGVYVFCDKPPRKRVKGKKTAPIFVFGKALNPN